MTPETRLRTDLMPQKAQISFLVETSQIVHSTHDYEEIIAQVVRKATEALGNCAVLFAIEEGVSRLLPEAIYATESHYMDALSQFLFTDLPGMAGTATGLAAQNGESVLIPDTRVHEGNDTPYLSLAGVLSYLAVPVRSGGQLLGYLASGSTDPRRLFNEDDRTMAQAIADLTGIAMANARFMSKEVRLRQKAEVLLKVAKAIRSERNLAAVLQEIADVTWQFAQPDTAAILLIDEGSSAFRLAALTSLHHFPSGEGLTSPVQEGVLSEVLLERSPVFIQDLQESPLTDSEAGILGMDSRSASFLGVPILLEGTACGMLVLLWDGPQHRLQEEENELSLGVAELVALAIDNQRLIKQEAAAHSERILAEEVAKEREALIRQIVHDLRNSTQAISLINEEIESEGADRPEILLGVSAIDRQISFISNFLKEKLAWVKNAQGRPTLVPTDLDTALAHIEAQFEPLFTSHGQTLSIEPVPQGEQLTISEVQLDQILGNLLDNAQKYTPPGSTIRLWVALSDGWATLYVADDGPGIPLEDQPKIGQLGFRGSDQTEGSGIGLANVKKLVNSAGGLFGFTSRPGKGSTFFVSLPTTRWGVPS
ncbi:Alginate biosynthesis sensor protein KinB [compost metagenome]